MAGLVAGIYSKRKISGTGGGTVGSAISLYALRIAQKGLLKLVLQIVHFLFSMPVVYRPHPLSSVTDATAHAQALCWKGSSNHETASYASDTTKGLSSRLRRLDKPYSGYSARGVCAVQSYSYCYCELKNIITITITLLYFTPCWIRCHWYRVKTNDYT